MAWIYDLLNDETTLALKDGVNYDINEDGFSAPHPPLRQSFGGGGLLRDGSDLIEHVYGNRTVTLDIQIEGSSRDDLIANIAALHQMLTRAQEFSRFGVGSQVRLRRRWDEATNASDFQVLSGTLNLGQEASQTQAQNNLIPSSQLTLTCKPFIEGAAITAENWVADPNFAVAGTPLADWTDDSTATGTGTRITTDRLWNGAAHMLKLEMTGSSVGQQYERRNQVITGLAAAEIWSFGVYVEVEALSNCQVVLVVRFEDDSGEEIARYEDYEDTVLEGVANLMKFDGLITPTGTEQVRIDIRLQATAADATGTIKVGAWMGMRGASLPSIWVSCRDVRNGYADDSQITTNYIDIRDVPGDLSGKLQIKAVENETHVSVWAGARHGLRMEDAGIWVEGEDSATAYVSGVEDFFSYAYSTTALTTASGGVVRAGRLTHTRHSIEPHENPVRGLHEWTLTQPPKGQYRALARVGYRDNNTRYADREDYGFILGWEYGELVSSWVIGSLPDRLSEGNLAILDFGTITIPPIVAPHGAGEADFVLKLLHWWKGGSGVNFEYNGYAEWLLDSVLLLPVDLGSVFITKSTGPDIILLDTLGPSPRGAYVLGLDSNAIQEFPDQQGSPPEAHIDGTRVYWAFSGSRVTEVDARHGAAVSVTIVPRYLTAIGA